MLLGCLRSLDRQTGVRFETILVDNGSADGSLEAALALMSELSYPLRIIRNEHNAGFCAAI